MFKNVSQGTNIAPKDGHYMSVSAFFHQVEKNPGLHKHVWRLITKDGR